MPPTIFNRRFFRAVLLAPLSIVPFILVALLFDIQSTYGFDSLRSYIIGVYNVSLIILPITYAGMLFLGIPVHIALIFRNQVHRFNYVAFGLGGGVFAGILIGGIAFPFGPILFIFCGIIVSYAFWHLVR